MKIRQWNQVALVRFVASDLVLTINALIFQISGCSSFYLLTNNIGTGKHSTCAFPLNSLLLMYCDEFLVTVNLHGVL